MKHLLTASLIYLLAGCSSVAETSKTRPQPDRKETRTMSDTETVMTPKQLLTRFLKLMETSDSVDDFTPEKLSAAFDVPLNKFFFKNESISTKRYGFIQKLNPKWSQSVRFVKDTRIQNNPIEHLELAFHWQSSFGIHPDMTDVCEMKTVDFLRQAESIGFLVKPIRALGRAPILEGFALEKGKLRADIRLASGCIELIRID